MRISIREACPTILSELCINIKALYLQLKTKRFFSPTENIAPSHPEHPETQHTARVSRVTLSLTPPRQARPKTTPRQPAKAATNLTARLADPIRDLDPPQRHLHPALRNRLHDIDDSKRAAAYRPEDRHGSHAPQDELEVEIAADVRALVSAAHRHRKRSIAHHPYDDHVRAHGAVVVFLLLRLAHSVLLDLEAVTKISERLVIPRVNVELLGGHFELDGIALAADGGAEVGVDDIVALGAPGDIVGVAEGVDLQGADVGGKEGEVLGGGGEHVPRVKVEEGHEEVKSDG